MRGPLSRAARSTMIFRAARPLHFTRAVVRREDQARTTASQPSIRRPACARAPQTPRAGCVGHFVSRTWPVRPCALSSSANLPQSKRSTTCEHQEISPRASRGGMHGAHGQLQSARPRAVDTNTSPPHPLLPVKSSCSEHSKAGVLRGRLIVSAEQPRVGIMP